MLLRAFVSAVIVASSVAAQQAQISSLLTANALKADVSFLASDALEGRGTPSRGLDIAAEYIAAQFRRAGLEPAGDDGYFQTARLEQVTPNLTGFDLAYELPERTVHAQNGAVSLQEPAAVDLQHAAIVKRSEERRVGKEW